MELRDLSKQYETLKNEIDEAVKTVLNEKHFIMGRQVAELEKKLAVFVGTRYCITCANGTDALLLALMAWGVREKDAVFVPDFTFFSTAEVIAHLGAVPVFVDVEEDTFNMSPESLEEAIRGVIQEGKYHPSAVIAVDLFGSPACYSKIRKITESYDLRLLEDGAQGFGGRIAGKRACSFGDISTTSFFPAKPLGCYGDGGAIFTDQPDWAEKIKALRVHGKGSNKYDNVYIGLNSRLDTIQAAILEVKLRAFAEYELDAVNKAAALYGAELKNVVKIPEVKFPYYSCWAQYTIRLSSEEERTEVQEGLRKKEIPSMIYYPKPLHCQTALKELGEVKTSLEVSEKLCHTVLSIPIHPYLEENEIYEICGVIREIVV